MRTPAPTLGALLVQQLLVVAALVGPMMTDERPSWFWLFVVGVIVWEGLLIRDIVRWHRERAHDDAPLRPWAE